MSSINLFFIFIVALCAYINFTSLEKINLVDIDIKEQITKISSDVYAISKKLEVDEKVRLIEYKVQKNHNVFQGTACIQCHNSKENALPIYKRSVDEAINIVRNGTEASIKGGMPKYLARATRDIHSITDADLKVRLDVLYTPELLKTAKEVKEVKEFLEKEEVAVDIDK